MNKSDRGVNAWRQESLLPPPVVTVTLRCGIWTGSGDVQMQLEAHDETTRDLIAMISWPVSDVRSASRTFELATSNLHELIVHYRGPFSDQ